MTNRMEQAVKQRSAELAVHRALWRVVHKLESHNNWYFSTDGGTCHDKTEMAPEFVEAFCEEFAPLIVEQPNAEIMRRSRIREVEGFIEVLEAEKERLEEEYL